MRSENSGLLTIVQLEKGERNDDEFPGRDIGLCVDWNVAAGRMHEHTKNGYTAHTQRAVKRGPKGDIRRQRRQSTLCLGSMASPDTRSRFL